MEQGPRSLRSKGCTSALKPQEEGMHEYCRANQQLWDEYTRINAASPLYELDRFKAGAIKLHPLERSELEADVSGKTLLHLQCHFGMDTLSWARLGARVTGMDFSEKAIALARSLSEELLIPARFVCCDLYDLPRHLDGEFDIVFTSYGVLTWLPDLRSWAELVARYLRPGGLFYIAEFHPAGMLFSEKVTGLEWRVGYDYFREEVSICQAEGNYSDRTATLEHNTAHEWTYQLGTVVSELIRAGLRIEYLHEHPFTVYGQFPFLERREDTHWHLPEGMLRVPLLFSLRAVKA
jgi:SAM-dependent methyltransferase